MARAYRDKVVFITGASSGIGAALARVFAAEGARVVVAARRQEHLDAVVAEIEAAGGHAMAVTCDVTDPQSVDASVARAVDRFGGIDVVIANAGFGVAGNLEALAPADYRRQFDTNFFGVIHTVYSVLPHLRAARGQLGFVASVAGRLGTPGASAYSASKSAVIALAESLYYECAKQGVAVTCIEPGFVESEIRRVDNLGQLHPRAKDPVPKWLMVSSDRAARAILRAMRREQFEAVITAHGKAMVFMARHFPRTCRFLIRQFSGKAVEAPTAPRRG